MPDKEEILMRIRYEIKDEDCLFPVFLSCDVHFIWDPHTSEVKIDRLENFELVTWVTKEIGVTSFLEGDSLKAACRLIRSRIEDSWNHFVEACQKEYDIQTSPW